MSTLPSDTPRCRDDRAPVVDLVIEARPRPVGSIAVARVLPAPRRRMVGPSTAWDR